jgi:hypothetical protein
MGWGLSIKSRFASEIRIVSKHVYKRVYRSNLRASTAVRGILSIQKV